MNNCIRQSHRVNGPLNAFSASNHVDMVTLERLILIYRTQCAKPKYNTSGTTFEFSMSQVKVLVHNTLCAF